MTAGTWRDSVLSGRFAGRQLSTLSDREVMELLAELRHDGAPEAAVMEAYLDWRLPGWRDQMHEHRLSGRGPGGAGRAATA